MDRGHRRRRASPRHGTETCQRANAQCRTVPAAGVPSRLAFSTSTSEAGSSPSTSTSEAPGRGRSASTRPRLATSRAASALAAGSGQCAWTLSIGSSRRGLAVYCAAYLNACARHFQRQATSNASNPLSAPCSPSRWSYSEVLSRSLLPRVTHTSLDENTG